MGIGPGGYGPGVGENHNEANYLDVLHGHLGLTTKKMRYAHCLWQNLADHSTYANGDGDPTHSAILEYTLTTYGATPVYSAGPDGRNIAHGHGVHDCVLAGHYDSDYTYLANLWKTYAPNPIIVRIAHEFQLGGPSIGGGYGWTIWGGSFGTNTKLKYRRMWRRIAWILKGSGTYSGPSDGSIDDLGSPAPVGANASNVFRAWCAVSGYSGDNSELWFHDCYPGDDVVDILQVDIYANGGQLYDNAFVDQGWSLREFLGTNPANGRTPYPFCDPNKPIMIAEHGVHGGGAALGSTYDARKTSLLTKIYNTDLLGDYSMVESVWYFNTLDGPDEWRIQGDARYQATMHDAWAASYYKAGKHPSTVAVAIASRSPAANATGVATAAAMTVTFDRAMAPRILAQNNLTLTPAGGAAVAGTITYNETTETATFQPSAALLPGTTYTARVVGGTAGVRELGLPRYLTADATWTFTTAGAPASSGTVYFSDLNYQVLANGWPTSTAVGRDTSIEGGPIQIRGVTYSKGIGTHAVSDVSGTVPVGATGFAATVGIDDEIPDGNETDAGVAFQVWTRPTAGSGTYTKVYDSGPVDGNDAAIPVSVSLTNVGEIRLVAADSNNSLSYDHADWGNARFLIPTDTTPPTVASVTPVENATQVTLASNITATFSEAMDATTLTTATVAVRKTGAGSDLAATVTYNAATKTVTLDPTPSFEYDAQYTVTIKSGAAGVKDSAGNALAADKVWTFTTIPDPTAPTVVSISPTAGAFNVALGTNITVTFSKAMNAATLTTTTFKVRKLGAGSDVPATVSYDGPTRTATLDPTGNLENNATYTVTVLGGSSGVKDTTGLAMSTHYTWTFTTPDTLPPTVTGTDPTNGATGEVVNDYVRIFFSEAIDQATLTTSTFRVRKQGAGSDTAGQVGYVVSTRTGWFLPSVNFDFSSTYTVTIVGGSGGVTDAWGNALASDYVFSFTTMAEPDTTPPTVTAVAPANNASNVAVSTTVTATFSEGMDASTITTGTVTLRKQGAGSDVVCALRYDSSTRTVTLTPTVPLEHSASYTGTVKGGSSGVKDLAGNALAVDRTWTFQSVQGPQIPALVAYRATRAVVAPYEAEREVGEPYDVTRTRVLPYRASRTRLDPYPGVYRVVVTKNAQGVRTVESGNRTKPR